MEIFPADGREGRTDNLSSTLSKFAPLRLIAKKILKIYRVPRPSTDYRRAEDENFYSDSRYKRRYYAASFQNMKTRLNFVVRERNEPFKHLIE